MAKRVAIGQAGGPTAVINASLVGFVEALHQEAELFGVYNGYQGLFENDMEKLDSELLGWIKLHKLVNGACLGSGRYEFTKEKMQRSISHLKSRGIDTLVFIGGNGTMAALQKLSEEARQMKYDLQVIGIPKTVDNDLAETDHAPGFGSAARYIATSVRDISRDLCAMQNFEQVRILETMGRNTGWLAAASGLLKNGEKDGPHYIYVPERPINHALFIDHVHEAVRSYGYATVVVAEGCTINAYTDQVEKATVNGRAVLGGISKVLEDIVKTELGVMARAEILGMNQRSSSTTASTQDRIEAYEAGREAARLVCCDETERMVTIQRTTDLDYNFSMNSCPLHVVAQGGERFLPDAFIDDPEAFYNWLRPLAGKDLQPYPIVRKRRIRNEKHKHSSIPSS
ncbi:diphosphate--fructose-6-phosphate 1-phosphotransferase [Fictibacillus nanhaiensis]|uniref:diphosphate--fructose-6-phosphate 1-phosphotransferase n=1 Tax=Fictibacillus nanhaiensis TaxID=742169 RepID=UPI001C976AD6|nr:diphosphate--fructose-6-phosphate 1-phosphotransferase [Fictibacillus nanhaiensis]MBY6036929.1 diphosphate--fructose-6-phosphate 1-phosphotransferase [Fictibacillus nanhaiensis]